MTVSDVRKLDSLPFQKFISFRILGTVRDNFHVVVGVIRHLPNKDALVNIAASVRESTVSCEILERAAQTHCSPKTTLELSSVPLLLRFIGLRLSVLSECFLASAYCLYFPLSAPRTRTPFDRWFFGEWCETKIKGNIRYFSRETWWSKSISFRIIK